MAIVALVLLSFALGVEANSVDPIKQTKPAARAPQLTRANPKASIAVGADGSLAPSAAGQLAQVRSLPDPFCANGVLARGGNACCPAACGSCGGPDCEQRPGGGPHCCSQQVKAADLSCEDGPAPCVVNQAKKYNQVERFVGGTRLATLDNQNDATIASCKKTCQGVAECQGFVARCTRFKTWMTPRECDGYQCKFRSDVSTLRPQAAGVAPEKQRDTYINVARLSAAAQTLTQKSQYHRVPRQAPTGAATSIPDVPNLTDASLTECTAKCSELETCQAFVSWCTRRNSWNDLCGGFQCAFKASVPALRESTGEYPRDIHFNIDRCQNTAECRALMV